ncbi:hypothetical protein [Nostoc sp.]|nr:hypothetical protein [Nostoc sp. ChiQUE02]
MRRIERGDAYSGLRLRIIAYADHLEPGVYSLQNLSIMTLDPLISQ